MKRSKYLFFLFNLISFVAICQDSAFESLQSNIKADFAVPDIPAFKVLGADPTNILRPSTPEALATTFSGFRNDNVFILPNEFAAEISPYIIAKRDSITYGDYKENKFLYSLRFSVGTSMLDDNSTNLGLGVRATLIDKGDLKNDLKYIDKVFDILDYHQKLRDKYKQQFIDEQKIKAVDIAQSEKLQKQRDEYINEKIKENRQEDFDNELEKLKKKYEKENWNAHKMEVAFATLGTSPDSLAENTEFKTYSFWLTYAFPMFGNAGQGIGAINYQNVSNSPTSNNIAANFRLYLGNNTLKAFVEGQYEHMSQGKINNVAVNSGVEYRLARQLWLDFNLAWEYENMAGDSQSRFTSNFNVRFGI